MAITLEGIAVKFGVDKTELEEAFEDVNKASKTVDKALKAIGIGFVVKQMADLTSSMLGYVSASAEATATTDSYAKRLGLATDAMIDLQTAASQFGVEQEDVNEGIKNMSERIADAYINGTGSAKDALTALGLSLEDIANKAPDEQFLAVADALSKVEDESQRTFLAMEVGQEEFFKMNELIALGADGIRELIGETQHLNADLSAVDFENIRGMQTAANNAKTAFDSIIQQLTADLAPSLERVFNIAAQWFASFRDEGLPIIEEFFGSFIDEALFLAQKILPEILTVGSAVWEGLQIGISALWDIASQVLGFIGTGWALLFGEITGESDWIGWITENLSIAAKTWPQLISNAFLTIGSFISGVLGGIADKFNEIGENIADTILGVLVSIPEALGGISQEEFESITAANDAAQQERAKQGGFFDQLQAEQERLIAENNAEIQKAAEDVINDRETNQKNISDLIAKLVTTSPEQEERIKNAEERAKGRGISRGETGQRDRLAEANAKEAKQEQERRRAIEANTTEAFKVFNRAELEAKSATDIAKEQEKTTQAVVNATEGIINAIDGLIPGLGRQLKQNRTQIITGAA